MRHFWTFLLVALCITVPARAQEQPDLQMAEPLTSPTERLEPVILEPSLLQQAFEATLVDEVAMSVPTAVCRETRTSIQRNMRPKSISRLSRYMLLARSISHRRLLRASMRRISHGTYRRKPVRRQAAHEVFHHAFGRGDVNRSRLLSQHDEQGRGGRVDKGRNPGSRAVLPMLPIEPTQHSAAREATQPTTRPKVWSITSAVSGMMLGGCLLLCVAIVLYCTRKKRNTRSTVLSVQEHSAQEGGLSPRSKQATVPIHISEFDPMLPVEGQEPAANARLPGSFEL